MREDLLLKGLTDEQIKKARECKNSDEILALAREEGVELTDEQLEAVSGGCGSHKKNVCSNCGSGGIEINWVEYGSNGRVHVFYTCPKCGDYDAWGWDSEYDI